VEASTKRCSTGVVRRKTRKKQKKQTCYVDHDANAKEEEAATSSSACILI
jgi:hypothetical protein